AVGVGEVGGLADQVVGRRVGVTQRKQARDDARQLGAGGYVQRHVIQAGTARRNTRGGAAVQHDGGLGVAEVQGAVLLGEELEAQHATPEAQRGVSVGDGQVHLAQFGGSGEEQRGRG